MSIHHFHGSEERTSDSPVLQAWWDRARELAAAAERNLTLAATMPEVRVVFEEEEVMLGRTWSSEFSESGRLARNADPGTRSAALLRAGIPRGTCVVLELPASHILRRKTVMPRTSRGNLGRALGFEVERLCPLPAEQLYFDFAVVDAGDKSQVDLRLIKRSTVDGAVASLDGLRVGAIVFSGDVREADWRRFPVDPIGRARLLATRWRIAILGVMAAVLLLAMTMAAYDRGTQTLDAISAQANAGARQVLAVRKVRREAVSIAGRQQLLAKRRAALSPAAILAELSRILPDGTWVAEASIVGTKVRIQGNSRGAADLIGIVDRSPLFANARFEAPVVQGGSDGEQFDLAFEARGGR